MKRTLDAIIVFAVLVFCWQAVVSMTDAPPYILPAPMQVAATLIEARALIAVHALATAAEVLLGLVIGAGLGGLTALLLALSDRAARYVLPAAVVTQAIPVFALAPLLTLWLGYGMWSKVAMALLIIYFPVVSTFLDGLRRTDAGLMDLARVMGAGRWRTLFHIRVPAALPSFGSGLRLAAVYAPIGAVIGEWVGSSRGLGYLMLFANGRSEAALMFAALLVLALFTVALHAGVAALAQILAERANGRVAGSSGARSARGAGKSGLNAL